MDITAYHAKYFAHDLTRRYASDSVEKLASVLSDAQVDLNPHQIEAALFAFRSPFSRGAILADEVGLGKTIEAGLLLAQKWAERKQRLLVIVPANLRKQWSQELVDKFHLPSTILEKRSFNDTVRTGNLNPFQQQAIVICSYQFARKKEPYLRQTPWDLVVIDEAHRLRNVYKASNKIATAIKQAVAPFPKVLLTATPLQNSPLELYGLVSIIDDYAFGDLKTYRSRFTRLGNTSDFNILEQTEFAGKVMLFNGTNTGPQSRDIYRRWLEKHAGTDRISGSPSADMRAALVEYFRDEDHLLLSGVTDRGEILDAAQ
jgi:SNF2 family DNA or RNA helicase